MNPSKELALAAIAGFGFGVFFVVLLLSYLAHKLKEK